MSHKVKVPRVIRMFLNPFSNRTIYDVKAVIYELYSHITIVVLIICFFNNSLGKFNKDVWNAVSIALMGGACAVGYFCGSKFENNRVVHIMMIVIGVIFLFFALLPTIACIIQ